MQFKPLWNPSHPIPVSLPPFPDHYAELSKQHDVQLNVLTK